jgi:hypothetical protein
MKAMTKKSNLMISHLMIKNSHRMRLKKKKRQLVMTTSIDLTVEIRMVCIRTIKTTLTSEIK